MILNVGVFIFSIAPGKEPFISSAIYEYKGKLTVLAAALQTASETDRIALAPKTDLLLDPSRSCIVLSIRPCLTISKPLSLGAITRLTLSTAFVTPIPPYRLASSSLSSTASYLPTDAPDGTEATADISFDRVTVVSTVGLPRESRISIAVMFLMETINEISNF